MKISVKAYETELKNLFMEVFSESDFFTDLIFKEQLFNSHCFALKENSKIISFLYAIEKEIRIKSTLEKCIYIYGVGTKKEYRGKGCMKMLLEEAYSYFQNKNAKFLYLVPASSELFFMYEKMGFKTDFYLDKKTVKLENSSKIQVNDGDYYADYEKFSKNFDNIILNSEKDTKTVLKYTKYLKIRNSGFLYEESEKTVYIRECFIENNKDFEDLLLYFGSRFETAVITKAGGNIPYAMIKPYSDFKLQGSRYTNMNFD